MADGTLGRAEVYFSKFAGQEPSAIIAVIEQFMTKAATRRNIGRRVLPSHFIVWQTFLTQNAHNWF